MAGNGSAISNSSCAGLTRASIIFALLAPPGRGSEHLRALARVARALRRPEIREQLRNARTPDAVHAAEEAFLDSAA